MTTERQTLTAKRDKLLSEFNSKASWDPERYDEVVSLDKSISGMPDDEPELELKPPRKTR
ncbi:hypothetical protein [Rhizobium sp. Leaf383]|uniref:hypothetical protein n=1 Tax=Rhizobium sp. Leaf383 TaxID=1736357 RepID=UPI0012E32F55|nr:hypothetical protein [Rhizobium sp. Leaf383]